MLHGDAAGFAEFFLPFFVQRVFTSCEDDIRI